jgi:twitching motility protein PilT
VETSGYQPVSPEPEEPTEQPGGFSPGPLPMELPDAEQGSWAYSFVADQAPDATAAPESAPLRSVLDGPASTLHPEPAAVPTYSLVDPVAPATSNGYADAPSHRKEEPSTVAHVVALPSSPAPFPKDVVPVPADQEAVVKIAESEASEEAYQRTSTEVSEEDDISLNDLLIVVLDSGASDLHLTSGARPALRINGELIQMEDQPILTPPVIQRVMYAALTQKQREKFEENLELDFAYSVPGRARFRVNIYRQRDALGAAFRIIPFEIRKLEDLGVPPAVANFAQLARGFVLVTGPTGSGKSTTLASLIDMANRTRSEHIMTVEDPIEFLHRHRKCLVNQREVGEDTWSFANALKHVLRQDPDIILVGEMRDLETISVALTAAETGHLVFATLHTQDAAQTIDRIIDVFPPGQQQQVRIQLAGTLQGIVCQTLARTSDGNGRAVATEVLVATPAVRNLIREGKTHQIYSAMQAGAKHGMHTMDQHLADLVLKGRITMETGLEKCHHIEDFNRLAGRA